MITLKPEPGDRSTCTYCNGEIEFTEAGWEHLDAAGHFHHITRGEIYLVKKPAATPQPDPQPGKQNVGEHVLSDIQARIDAGEQKYGTKLQTFNGRDPLWDALQESIDLVFYLRQELLERSEIIGAERRQRVMQDLSIEGHFAMYFNLIADSVHANAKDKGFWDTDRNDGEALMLMVSELAEALEALRHGNPPDDKVPEFSGVEAELADTVIRIMDLAAGRGWRVAEAVIAKMAYNQSRERKHGKAF